jgi:hypothetical protein
LETHQQKQQVVDLYRKTDRIEAETGQDSEDFFFTLAAAISRKATTTSRLSDSTSGLAPLKSCLARFEASMTSSKRLDTWFKQSSTVIRDILAPGRNFLLLNQILATQSTYALRPITLTIVNRDPMLR